MDIETRLARIERRLSQLVQENRKQAHWVKVSFIRQATGWNREKIRQARLQKLVIYEKRKTGFWYDINSIPQIFLNPHRHDNATATKSN